jgi:uncharacterized membrane protein YeiB
MEEDRRIVIYLGPALLFGLLVIFVTQAMVGFIVHTFYWGLPLGLLLGIPTWMYLHDAWDPVYLRPTNEDTARASWRLWWVVPLGVISANLLLDWFNKEVVHFILGIVIAWVYATIGYLVVQAWRHRPK